MPAAQVLNTGSALQSCPCDQVQGVSEYQCCCDSDTGSITPAICINKDFGNLFFIPFYSDLKTSAMSIDDLYNPLRLIYQVIKTLGSVLDRNSAQPTISFSLSSPSSTKDFANILLNQLNQQPFSQLPSYLQPEARVTNRYQMSSSSTNQKTVIQTPSSDTVNMYIRDKSTGKCIPYTATKYETVTYQACTVRNTNLYTALNAITPPTTAYCFDLDANYQITSTVIYPVATLCTTNAALNVIGFIYSYTSTNSVVYIRHPSKQNIFLGAKHFYDYDLQNSSTQTVTQKPKSGYNIGDPLTFFVQDSANSQNLVQKGLPFNDIYDYSGKCYSSSTPYTYNMLNPIDIQFGKNITIACSGSTWRTDSFLSSLTYVGIFPEANPIYSDWIAVATTSISPTMTASSNYAIQIYYQKQGKITNPTFRITNVYKQVINGGDSSKRVASVLFYEEPQSSNYYLSAPKQLQAKLPRDILYPFFTFNN